MARYRKIDVRMYGDEKFCRLSKVQPSGQSLFIYLLTNPAAVNVPGLYRAGAAALAEELEWPLEAFQKAFAEVSREGMVRADWKARVVWVPNAIHYNEPESPNVVKSWRVMWDEIPECALKNEAYWKLRGFCEAKGEGFLEAFKHACAKAKANQEQEQEQESHTRTARARISGGDVGAVKGVALLPFNCPADLEPTAGMVAALVAEGCQHPDAECRLYIAHYAASSRREIDWTETGAPFARWAARHNQIGCAVRAKPARSTGRQDVTVDAVQTAIARRRGVGG